VTLKTAWFMSHRIREASNPARSRPPWAAKARLLKSTRLSSAQGSTEVRRGYAHKNIVLSLVERAARFGRFHVDSTRKDDLIPIVRANIAKESRVMTDEAVQYAKLGDDFAGHDAVDHGRGEYGYTDRRDGTKINTNTLKATTRFSTRHEGVYQHCAEKHFIAILPSSISAKIKRIGPWC